MRRLVWVSILFATTACDDDFVLPSTDLNDGEIAAIVGLTPDTANGSAIFGANCAQCHNEDGTAGGVGPSMIAWFTTATDADTLRIIYAGEGAMPAFDFPDQDAADLLGWMKDTYVGEAPPDPALSLTGDADSGAGVYDATCKACHPTDGSPGVGPSMSAWMGANEDAATASIIRNGKGIGMPSFPNLSDQDVADLLAWLNREFN